MVWGGGGGCEAGVRWGGVCVWGGVRWEGVWGGELGRWWGGRGEVGRGV